MAALLRDHGVSVNKEMQQLWKPFRFSKNWFLWAIDLQYLTVFWWWLHALWYFLIVSGLSLRYILVDFNSWAFMDSMMWSALLLGSILDMMLWLKLLCFILPLVVFKQIFWEHSRWADWPLSWHRFGYEFLHWWHGRPIY